LGVREARESLERTREVELGDARKVSEDEGKLSNHDDLLGSHWLVG
jgi:hypothetical protein